VVRGVCVGFSAGYTLPNVERQRVKTLLKESIMWPLILLCAQLGTGAAGSPMAVLAQVLPQPHGEELVLVAHRGGVVGPESPEGSAAAIRAAAAAGYHMVELDVQPTRDQQPFVFHDRELEKAFGISGAFSELEAEAVRELRFVGNGEAPLSLQEALALCRALKLGVMLDIKRGESPLFFEEIQNALRETEYFGRVLCINRAPAVLEHLDGAVLFRVDDSAPGAAPEGVFWFGLPENLPDERVEELKNAGILLLPAINTFRYSAATHEADAAADIRRLRRAGVHGFQIDSVYQELFWPPRAATGS
jgi:glycerophosphoryl diester phosphodiesterase